MGHQPRYHPAAQARATLLRDQETFSRLTHALLGHGSMDETAIFKAILNYCPTQ